MIQVQVRLPEKVVKEIDRWIDRGKFGKKVDGGGKFTIRPILPVEFRFKSQFLDEKGNLKILDEMDLPTQHQEPNF